METCLEEFDIIQNGGDIDIDKEDKSSFLSILPKGRLLLAQWTAEEGNFSEAINHASEINQDSEFAAEAQEILYTLARREGGGIGE